eukprot:499274-Rhodomonas_salina.1
MLHFNGLQRPRSDTAKSNTRKHNLHPSRANGRGERKHTEPHTLALSLQFAPGLRLRVPLYLTSQGTCVAVPRDARDQHVPAHTVFLCRTRAVLHSAHACAPQHEQPAGSLDGRGTVPPSRGMHWHEPGT